MTGDRRLLSPKRQAIIDACRRGPVYSTPETTSTLCNMEDAGLLTRAWCSKSIRFQWLEVSHG